LCLFVWLVLDRRFDNRSLWNWGAFTRELPRIVVTAVVSFVVMVGLAWWFSTTAWAPEEVGPFALLKRDWVLLVAICLLYPLFSVYPQEIVLRTWFFHRYKRLIPDWRLLLTVNALTFAWVHVIFQNWVAVVLCVPAGFLFGWTYLKTKSTLASGFEHALVGNLMWTAGIGWFFFAGSVDAGGGGGGETPEAVVAPAEGASGADGGAGG
jgi:membrane protease YdiL (CAAX protease family)